MRSRWVLALVAVVGCNFGSPEAQTIDNSCANDASCPVGVCDGNICIDDSGASVDVAIEVLSSSRDLVLPATREVVGSVRWDGFRVPATLRFVRRMVGAVAPLVPVAIEVDTLRESAVADGEDAYDFSTVLVAGETYDVSVLPSNDMVTAPMQTTAPAIRSLPPIYMELAVDDGDPSEPFRFDVAFPAGLADGCTENVDIGCTLEAEVLSVNAEGELPEAGLQVRAIEKTTARVVSSIGETDENGRFAIRISDAAADEAHLHSAPHSRSVYWPSARYG
ncbi:MAG: hypothetical protein JRD94_08185 [Deltaproteobacteria bacterium]|nr:hypothetical protein [Deltaproteobacteria bacterium]